VIYFYFIANHSVKVVKNFKNQGLTCHEATGGLRCW